MKNEIGLKVKAYRESIGKSQEEFGKFLKTSQAVISDIESGKEISKVMAKKLSGLINVPIQKLIWVIEEE